VGGNLDSRSNVTASGSIDVTGWANIDGATTSSNSFINVTGAWTNTGAVQAKDYVQAGSNATFGGSVTAQTNFIKVAGTTVASNTLSAGTYVTLAGAATLGGNVTAGSNITFGGATVLTGSGARTLDAGTGTFMAQSTLNGTTNGNLSINGGAGIVFSNNVTVAQNAYLTSTNGSILQTGIASFNASNLSFLAGQNVALTNLNIKTVAGTAGNSIILSNAGALTIGSVGSQTGLTGIAGDVKVQSGGAINVTNAVRAGRDVLLDAKGGTLTLNTNVTAGRDASLLTSADLIQNADGDVNAGGTVDAQAGGNITMADGAKTVATGNLRYLAATNVLLGNITAANARIEATAGSITANSDPDVDIEATAAQLVAGGAIGTNTLTPNGPIDTKVGTLAAQAGNGNIYISEADDLSVGSVSAIGVNRVEMNGSSYDPGSALNGANAPNGSVKIEAGSSLTVDRLVNAGSDVLLDAKGGNLTLNSSVTAGRDASLIAANNLAQNANVTATTGTVDADAKAGSITMANGALTTARGNARYRASQNVTLGGVNALNARIEATGGNIIDGGDSHIDVEADGVQLVAGGTIGSGNAIDTKATTLAVSAHGAVGINESDDVTVGNVGAISVNRIGMDSTSSPQAGSGLENISSAGGDIVMEVGGNLDLQGDINAGSGGNIELTFTSIAPGGRRLRRKY